MAISDVARVLVLRTSAIRYYEHIGVLPPHAQEWQRRYNNSALFRLGCGAACPRDGIYLEEIREALLRLCGRDASTEALASALQRKVATPGTDQGRLS